MIRSGHRILVLTASMGGLSNSYARSFSEWCKFLYGEQVDVRVVKMLEESSLLLRATVYYYNYIQSKSPWLHKAFFLYFELLSLLNRRSVSFGRSYYENVLRDFKPHVIVSVKDALNRGYFQLARAVLGHDQVRCVTYCSEFAGGFGYSINWVEPTADLYISRTATANEYAIRLGMIRSRTRVRGALLSPKTCKQIVRNRSVYRTNVLGLKPDRFTLFVFSYQRAWHLDELLPLADKLQIIIRCRSFKRLRGETLDWCVEHPEMRASVVQYYDNVNPLLQVSDAVLTRAGPQACERALHFNCPIILDAIGGVMPQEELQSKYLQKAGATALIGNSKELVQVLSRWVNGSDDYAAIRHKAAAHRHPESPDVLVEEIVGLAKTVRGARLTPV